MTRVILAFVVSFNSESPERKWKHKDDVIFLLFVKCKLFLASILFLCNLISLTSTLKCISLQALFFFIGGEPSPCFRSSIWRETTQESGHIKRPKRAVDQHRKTIKDDLLLFVIFVAWSQLGVAASVPYIQRSRPRSRKRSGACHSVQKCNSPLVLGMFQSWIVDMVVLFTFFSNQQVPGIRVASRTGSPKSHCSPHHLLIEPWTKVSPCRPFNYSDWKSNFRLTVASMLIDLDRDTKHSLVKMSRLCIAYSISNLSLLLFNSHVIFMGFHIWKLNLLSLGSILNRLFTSERIHVPVTPKK